MHGNSLKIFLHFSLMLNFAKLKHVKLLIEINPNCIKSIRSIVLKSFRATLVLLMYHHRVNSSNVHNV